MFVSCVCCVVCSSGLCNELLTCSEQSYRVCVSNRVPYSDLINKAT